MNFRSFQRIALIAMSAAVSTTALAQIPLPPPPPLPGLEVRITAGRPPALRHERRPPRPGRDSIWIAGFWSYGGNRWQWIPGRWELRAERDAYWIPPRYIRSEGAYIYEPGHWSNQTLVVGDGVRSNRAWRRHERNHGRELERERHREHYRDRD